MKIAIYTIALNEIKHTKRWADSVQDADYLVVADTGSTDGTQQALQSAGAAVYNIKVNPWRFDDARNIALGLVPDVDVCISMDMDEMMAPGWRQQLEKSWIPGTTRLRYSYVHDFDEHDRPHTAFMADKIHARFGYRWKRPVHETVFSVNDEQIVTDPAVIMWHKQDDGKGRGQYLSLLALAHAEDPLCSQTLFWYGREQAWNNDSAGAITSFKNYLLLSTSTWSDERSEAMLWLAKLLPHERVKWLRLSVAEAPHRRETWLDLADYQYSTQDWSGLYASAKQVISIQHKSGTYLDTVNAWGAKPWDLAGIAAWNIGLLDECVTLFSRAVELAPTDRRISNNLQLAVNALHKKGSNE